MWKRVMGFVVVYDMTIKSTQMCIGSQDSMIHGNHLVD